MPAYTFHAVDPSGVQKRGRIEAASIEAARRLLRDRSLLPVSIASADASNGLPEQVGQSTRHSRLTRKLPLRDTALAMRQLATLTGHGVRLEEALAVAARQAGRSPLSASLSQVRAAVTEGLSLSDALMAQAGRYPDIVRVSIAAGERSGKLDSVLAHLAAHLETRATTQNKLGLALLYPALLAGVSILLVTLLLIYVVPDIVDVFVARGADLPLLTRALIVVSSSLAAYWPHALAGLALVALAGRSWFRVAANRLRAHRLVNSTPGTRGFSRQLNSARFAGALATLVQSGVPLLEALRATASAAPNLHVRAAIEGAAARIHDGGSLSRALEEAGCFSPLLIAMVASGEGSGQLGPALERAGADQQRDLDAMVSTLVGLVEPCVLLVMGGVVLMLVLAILMPIVGLNNLAGG